MKNEDQPQRRASLAPLDVIRVETALSRFPVHRLAKAGTVHIELNEGNDKGGTLLRWEVSHNSKFGQPGPLAYKLDTLIINRKVEGAGRPTPRIVRLGSLNDICRELGQAESGKNKADIKRALYQNSSAYITAKVRYRANDGAERGIEIGDTRYAVVLTGERLPDGRVADGVFIVLHDFYREVLDNALTRPLDYEYLRELPPTAQRLYELASYPIFGAIKHGRSKARLAYSEFCTYAPQTRYFEWERVRKQMAKVHAPHRQSGYIADVSFEATTDREERPDWIMLYTPGPKARAEYKAVHQRGRVEATEPAGLERELVERGVSRGVAAELLRDHPEDHIKAKVAEVDWLRERHPRKVRDAGAYLVGAIREDYATPAGFRVEAERSERDQAEAERRRREVEVKAREREEQARVDEFWASMTPDQRTKIDAEALAKADSMTRASCESGPPNIRKMYIRIIRETHIRSLLNLPAAG